MFLQEHLDSDCSSPSRCFSTAGGAHRFARQGVIGVFIASVPAGTLLHILDLWIRGLIWKASGDRAKVPQRLA